jgi:peptidoglycan hydrolase-like protein with peptidoglycan-binding domain
MTSRLCRCLMILAALLAPALIETQGWAGLPAAAAEQTVPATPILVREIQFMLLSVGLDPGPLDGNAQQMTNRAVHLFQQRRGLPVTDLVNNAPISAAFVERLRQEAAQTLLKGANPPASTASVAPPPPTGTPVVRPEPAPPPPPADRFASCSYNPEDFRVGGKQYTPQSFLDEGFDGVTSRAVSNMRARLEEARQIAEKIGGPALIEVQRQAHVLAYFECRQKIEQAAAKTN